VTGENFPVSKLSKKRIGGFLALDLQPPVGEVIAISAFPRIDG